MRYRGLGQDEGGLNALLAINAAAGPAPTTAAISDSSGTANVSLTDQATVQNLIQMGSGGWITPNSPGLSTAGLVAVGLGAFVLLLLLVIR